MKTLHARCLLSLLVLSPLVNAGCDAPEDDVALKTGTLWTQTTFTQWPLDSGQYVTPIRVCFDDTEPVISPSEKVKIRKFVEDLWEKAALLNFWDWGTCPTPLPSSDVVRVSLDPAISPLAGHSNAWGKFTSGPNIVRFVAEPISTVTIAHEFGHVLGFQHSTEDSGAPCVARTGDGVSLENQSDIVDSVMAWGTHCYGDPKWNEWRHDGLNVGLSAWDVIGVQRLYGRKPSGAIVGLNGLGLAASATTAGASIIGWPVSTAGYDRWVRDQGMLKAQFSGVTRCLDVYGGAVSPSGPTQIDGYTCVPSATSQQFSFTGVEWRAMGNKCVAAASQSVGAKISIQNCDPWWSLQKWDVLNENRIRLSNSNLCVSVPGTPALGVELELATCQTTDDTFTFANYRLDFENMCVNVLGGLATPGSKLGLWNTCGSTAFNAQFSIKGPIHIMDQCIEMTGGAPYDGVSISAAPCSGAATQTWEYYW